MLLSCTKQKLFSTLLLVISSHIGVIAWSNPADKKQLNAFEFNTHFFAKINEENYIMEDFKKEEWHTLYVNYKYWNTAILLRLHKKESTNFGTKLNMLGIILKSFT